MVNIKIPGDTNIKTLFSLFFYEFTNLSEFPIKLPAKFHIFHSMTREALFFIAQVSLYEVLSINPQCLLILEFKKRK